MAHCTGCGLWLRENELFCGICGSKRPVGDPGDRDEPDLGDEPTRLAESVESVSVSARTEPSEDTLPAESVSAQCQKCGWPAADDECLRCGYVAPAQIEPPWGDKAQRAGWRRALEYAATVLVWLVLVVALGAMLGGAAGFVAAALGSLGIAAALRWFYAWKRNRSFMSPWLFASAAVFAFLSSVGQTARQNDATGTRADQRGTATSNAAATPGTVTDRFGGFKNDDA